jgi:hypothetical protein
MGFVIGQCDGRWPASFMQSSEIEFHQDLTTGLWYTCEYPLSALCKLSAVAGQNV